MSLISIGKLVLGELVFRLLLTCFLEGQLSSSKREAMNCIWADADGNEGPEQSTVVGRVGSSGPVGNPPHLL